MKKAVLIFFVLSINSLCYAQKNQPILKDSLSITNLITLGELVNFGDYDIKFKTLISDSRCPRSVMCNRAGEAKVEVSIYKSGNLVADKKIVIDASGYVMESNNLIYKSTNFKIYGFTLTPYPDISNATLGADYKLEIVFIPI